MLDTGRHPRMGFEPHLVTRNAEADEFINRLKRAQEEAQAALQQAAEDMKRFYDRDRKEVPEYKVGDRVWLSSQNISITRPTKKLTHRWLGPYEITKLIGSLACRLKLPQSMSQVHPVFHVSLLRPADADPILERPQYTHPDPEIDNEGNLQWEVKAVVDSRLYGRWKKLQYHVQWQGYGPEYDTWEPAENLAGSQELVKEFHAAHPGAPGPRLEPRN